MSREIPKAFEARFKQGVIEAAGMASNGAREDALNYFLRDMQGWLENQHYDPALAKECLNAWAQQGLGAHFHSRSPNHR